MATSRVSARPNPNRAIHVVEKHLAFLLVCLVEHLLQASDVSGCGCSQAGDCGHDGGDLALLIKLIEMMSGESKEKERTHGNICKIQISMTSKYPPPYM